MDSIERRAVAKRLGCMICSLSSLGGFGSLVAGVGGYLFGKGRPLFAAAGAAAGVVLAAAALYLWKGYLKDIEILSLRDGIDDKNDPDDPSEAQGEK